MQDVLAFEPRMTKWYGGVQEGTLTAVQVRPGAM